MRHRLLEICLRAYPRSVRARDGQHLHDLATELARDHGVAREALGLLRGGVTERWRRSRTGRTAVVLGTATLTAVVALTGTAAAQGLRAEEDLITCAGSCVDARAEVAARVQDGWSCTAHGRETLAVTWRCVRD